MHYPDAFVEKVKGEFPDFTLLHRHLDAGDIFVGRILRDHVQFAPRALDDRLRAMLHENPAEARALVARFRRRRQLLDEWRALSGVAR
jgi:hypothetical protein